MLLLPPPSLLPPPAHGVSCNDITPPSYNEVNAPTGHRKYDVVIFGATGFTGKLVSEYLAEVSTSSEGKNLKWAVAGRSQSKLDALVSTFSDAAQKKVGVILADASDDESLKAMAQSTKVILTTTGPYALFGLPLLGHCASAGTHYADLSGEFFFQKSGIDKYQDVAIKSGAKIVVAAGYDSTPFDFGVEVLREELEKTGSSNPSFADVTTHVTSIVTMMHGWASGGTIMSAFGGVKEAISGVMEGTLTMADVNDPYMLTPELKLLSDEKKKCVIADPEATGWGTLPRYDPDVSLVGIPHFMAYVNSRIVRRSQYLLRPGHRFSYKEGMSIYALMDAFMWCVPYVWRGDVKLNPAAGEGPNQRMRNEGGFELTMVGSERDSFNSKNILKGPVELKVVGSGDPGYRRE
jgi:short subunit dehydrogenase-like uncharacterized protein